MINKYLIYIYLIVLSLVVSGSASAQYPNTTIMATNSQIAFINSAELLEFVPGKTEATRLIEELNKKYKEELTIMQNDYNNKYTDFLSNQNNMAESIKLRRMQELYELEQNINRFMKIAQEDINTQEQNLIQPLRDKLSETVTQVGMERGYICIYDKSNSAVAFLTPDAVDANPLIKAKLQIRK